MPHDMEVFFFFFLNSHDTEVIMSNEYEAHKFSFVGRRNWQNHNCLNSKGHFVI